MNLGDCAFVNNPNGPLAVGMAKVHLLKKGMLSGKKTCIASG